MTVTEEDASDDFSAREAAVALMAKHKYGDSLTDEQLSKFLKVRLPLPHDTYQDGTKLQLIILQRRQLLFRELLVEHKIYVQPDWRGGIDLIHPKEQVDAVLEAMRDSIDNDLKKAMRAVSHLETKGLSNSDIVHQRDTAAYIDALRHALNRRSRKLKDQVEFQRASRDEVIIPIPTRGRLV